MPCSPPVEDLSAAGFCKQQLWPLFHYLLPLSPGSNGRFDPDLWQAYVKANKVGCGTVAALIAVHHAAGHMCLNLRLELSTNQQQRPDTLNSSRALPRLDHCLHCQS